MTVWTIVALYVLIGIILIEIGKPAFENNRGPMSISFYLLCVFIWPVVIAMAFTGRNNGV